MNFDDCHSDLRGIEDGVVDTWILDRLWALNKLAYDQFVPMGKGVGPLFLLLSAALTAAAMGWFKPRLWGWRLAVGIIAVQVGGDFLLAML